MSQFSDPPQECPFCERMINPARMKAHLRAHRRKRLRGLPPIDTVWRSGNLSIRLESPSPENTSQVERPDAVE